MKIKDQVCSIEQAKTLKALGVKQKSIFTHYCRSAYNVTPEAWFIHSMGDVMSWGNQETFGDYYKEIIKNKKQTIVYSAFTLSELGIMLPDNCTVKRILMPGGYNIYIAQTGDGHYEKGASEARSRAALLINLIKYGQVEINDINKRLSK